ncbi:helix-turn-helix domain-containing protein [Burkholderia stagnalis]|uniref:helix-turn-helix domain-containing protein n=1 Tax=Burkholderia stagnalis TaxID=1503054 RepID=UPI000F810892|nr:helix-turn-helix domain-containing protein [Burkholderia stagnalis]
MMNRNVLSRTQGSTANVPAPQRLAYWEAFNASTLVGLRCSSLSPHGFDATITNIALPGLLVADIRGSDHLIERSPAMVRALPKESVFACQVVRGSAYFVQRDRCVIVETGDTVVYDTRIPYLFGFLTPMRQFLIDVPISTFGERFDFDVGNLPLRIPARPGTGNMIGATFHATVDRFLSHPVEQDASQFCEHARTLLAAMIGCETRGARSSRASLSYLLTARQYIATHLAEPGLAPQAVADAVGLSLRHLSRLFAAEDQTITHYIWSQRLSRARDELVDPRLRKTTVSEIAFRWGFSSQAHFSRAIRERYGASPMGLRASAST